MGSTATLERSAEMLGRDSIYCWHPYMHQAENFSPHPIVRAFGSELFTGSGNTLIDAISSWWVNVHGHGHPALIESITRQLAQVDHIMFADLTHEPATLLAERLSNTLPGNPQRIFYSDNGSTAVEAALKMALQYWYNRLGKAKKKIIAFKGGFHGETFGAMALSCRSLFSKPFSSFLFDVEFISPPTTGREQSSLEEIKRLVASGEVACFIFEPCVQGAAGMVPHSPATLGKLIEVCRDAGVITIADEVMTGCGRLGPLFASELLSASPDIICLGKSLTGGILPLGVTACSEWIYEAFAAAEESSFLHGHTYCGNPPACAVAITSLELLDSPESRQQRDSIYRSHLEAQKRFLDDKRIQRVDVIGTLMAIELRDATNSNYFYKQRQLLTSFYLERGVHLRPLGNVIYVLPPYCIAKAQLEKIYATIEASLSLFSEDSL